jgi:hypothetical protein
MTVKQLLEEVVIQIQFAANASSFSDLRLEYDHTSHVIRIIEN